MMFQKAVKQNLKARIALAGVAGSGKTFTGLTLASGLGQRIAVIDTENDRASLYADTFEFDKLNLAQHAPQLYTQAIQAAESAGYDVIVIDSLSHAWNGRGGALEMVNARGGRFQDWAQVTPHQNALMDAIINSRCHVIATMRTKTEYAMEQSGKRTTVRKLGTAAVQRDGVEYEFDIVAQMDMNHNMTITKTRYAALDNRTIPQPKGDLAAEILGWLNSGAEPAQAAEAIDTRTYAERRQAAIDWSMTQGVFTHVKVAHNSFEKMLREQFDNANVESNQDAVFSAWAAKVRGKVEAAQQS